MTPERLAEIRTKYATEFSYNQFVQVVPDLLDEVGRLTTENAALRAQLGERGDWTATSNLDVAGRSLEGAVDPRDEEIARLRAELDWHEGVSGTREEQEAEAAEAEEEWAAIDALSDDEVRRLNEAEGLDTPTQRKRFDVFLRVLTRETMVKAKLADVTAAARRLVTGEYPAWTSAGGLDECEHGIAGALNCRACDLAVVMGVAHAGGLHWSADGGRLALVLPVCNRTTPITLGWIAPTGDDWTVYLPPERHDGLPRCIRSYDDQLAAARALCTLLRLEMPPLGGGRVLRGPAR